MQLVNLKTDGAIDVIHFTEDMPYILYLSFIDMDLKSLKKLLKGILFLKLIKPIKTIRCRMGLSESSLTTITKPFSFSSHCKVSCDSPCCTKICGEDNRCIFNIDTHENVNSDSDGDEHGNVSK